MLDRRYGDRYVVRLSNDWIGHVSRPNRQMVTHTHAEATRISRRRLGRLVVGVLSIAGLRRASVAAAGTKYRVFRFDPLAIDPLTGASCRGCGACQRHAEHKRFASFEAADARRAHPHCRCAITTENVTRAQFVELFGDPEGESFRDTFDARWNGAPGTLPTIPSGGLEMPAVGVR